MNYCIQVNAAGEITHHYAGGQFLASPWIGVTKAQYDALVPGATWNGTAIVPPPPPPAPTAAQVLASVQASQIKALDAACAEQIVSGFNSSALGTPHLYASTPTDQANLVSAAVAAASAPAGWTTPCWCGAPGAAWTFEQHTAAQIMQVHSDFLATVAGARMRLAALVAAVQAETDVAVIQAERW
jgi:hypothetical protein